MARRIKPKEDMCAFKMKEIGRNLEGEKKEFSGPKVAQKGPSWC